MLDFEQRDGEDDIEAAQLMLSDNSLILKARQSFPGREKQTL